MTVGAARKKSISFAQYVYDFKYTAAIVYFIRIIRKYAFITIKELEEKKNNTIITVALIVVLLFITILNARALERY